MSGFRPRREATSAASAPPGIEWAANAYTAREGQGSIAVTLVRTGIATGTATVHYATSDGLAKRAADYRVRSGSVTFAPGETSKTVVIPVLQDKIDELSEDFWVKLSGVTGASLPRPAIRVRILDDDPVPTVQWSAGYYSVDENGGYVTLTANLIGRKSTRVTVHYGTIDDTAKAGSDYSGVSGDINFFPGGLTSQSIRIPITHDASPEPGESFKVMLTGTASAMIGPNAVATVTVTE